MALASVSYTGTGSAQTLAIPFDYIQQSHIVVTVNGVIQTLGVGYTFASAGSISITAASGATILIARESSIAARLTDYVDGALLSEAPMDVDSKQPIYLIQELSDELDALTERVDAVDQEGIEEAPNDGKVYGRQSEDWVDVGSLILPQSGLVSGGQVAWVQDYTFDVAAATYVIGGVLLNSAATQVTLTAAHATLNRIDVIVVNTAGAVAVVEGTPSVTPSEPELSPDQLKLAFVLVTAGTTQPVDITNTAIYANNAGAPAEWNWTTSGSGFNVNSTNNPRSATKSIEGTSVANNAYALATKGSGTIQPALFDRLNFYVRSKATWAGTRSLQVQFFLSGVAVGAAITVRSGFYGFDSSITTIYQLISIPIPHFAISTSQTANQIRIRDAGGAIGFYIDDVALQTGGLTGTTVIGITQEQADARYVQLTDFTPSTGVWGGITGTLSNQTDLQTALNAKVAKAGDTMTGALTLPSDPTSALHAATKQYIDRFVAPLTFIRDFSSPANTTGLTLFGGTPAMGVASNQLELTSADDRMAMARVDSGPALNDFRGDFYCTLATSGSGTDEGVGVVYRTQRWGSGNWTCGYGVKCSPSAVLLAVGDNTGSSSSITPTVLGTTGTTGISFATEFKLTIDVQGSRHRVYIDDVLRLDVTDATYAAPGFLALTGYETDGGGKAKHRRCEVSYSSASAAAYGNFLPVTGGAMTGDISFNAANIKISPTTGLTGHLAKPDGNYVLSWSDSGAVFSATTVFNAGAGFYAGSTGSSTSADFRHGIGISISGTDPAVLWPHDSNALRIRVSTTGDGYKNFYFENDGSITLPTVTGTAGSNTLYHDGSTIYYKNGSGTEVDLAAGGASVATDAIFDAKGDLAVGTGANTAVKLTVGTNDYVLTADSAETTGMKWAAPSSSRAPNVQSVSSAATVTPTFSNDIVTITAQAAALDLANPTGTAINGLGMVIRIKDNGTARAITYGTQYRAIGVTLPSTTVVNKTLYLAMVFNNTDTKWDVLAVGQEA